MAAHDREELIAQFRKNMADVAPLTQDEDFHTRDETLMRYLKAREWKLQPAEKLLRETVEWRRNTHPLFADCKWCHDRPGFHCMRQVGHDEQGRPVIYSCFAQASVQRVSADDTVAHATYLIENAKKTMAPGIHTWVFVVDCTGMNIASCNPRLAYGVTNIFSNHYPERLGLVIVLNHNPIFQGVLKAIKVFLHPNTLAKLQLVRGKKKIRETFDKHFSAELAEWLLEEIKVNKQHSQAAVQKTFWQYALEGHDPRGAPAYVRHYVDTYKRNMQTSENPLKVHNPHPNIVDALVGKLKTSTSLSRHTIDSSVAAGATNGGNDSDNDDDQQEVADDIKIAEEYQAPVNAKPLHM